jgi:hypothetical protein
MRYNYEIFTDIILKDGFIILPCNMNALCLSDGSKLIRSLVSYGISRNIHLNKTLPHIH